MKACRAYFDLQTPLVVVCDPQVVAVHVGNFVFPVPRLSPAPGLKLTDLAARRKEGRKEGQVLFNDALNTFYLRLYGVGHMVKYHSDSGRKPAMNLHIKLIVLSCLIPHCSQWS